MIGETLSHTNAILVCCCMKVFEIQVTQEFLFYTKTPQYSEVTLIEKDNISMYKNLIFKL